MRTLRLLAAAAAAALVLAAPSIAALPSSARVLMSHTVKLTPSRQLALANRTVKHATDVLRFLKHNPMYGTPSSRMRVQHDHLWLLKFGKTEQRQAHARIESDSWPAHHSLWMCLLPHEGGRWDNQNTGGNGHWGGLQMHPGWGHGTAYHASDSPQIVQERAAEEGYRESGFSRSFLIGQWGQTIGYCWAYV